ncbi:F-box family protein [Tripterygium wilfordii]|uniref:F-box family protein n=1 Tax=Tripterygium wilfordii TaxID=458696 RepID=A0A7J7D8L8_TRIWF|nr:F-box protein At2g39490 [Tripterygium wilfordii]KAF5742654.1 F-box family protein [Tripterygium wilfordii]
MEANSDDLISGLPDDILLRIISSIPFESAIQTIFLSRRWRLLWNSTTLVQYGSRHDIAAAISSFVRNFNEHVQPCNNRKLRFHFGTDSVVSVIIISNDKLYIDFSSDRQEFPAQFGLKLDFNHQNPTDLNTFYVKTLQLVSVNHLTCEAVSSVVSMFQFLEDLKISDCRGLQSLYVGSDTKLRSLTIFDCHQLTSVHIRSFKLQTFRYRGLLPWLRPEYHFNLAEAMLDARKGPGCNRFKSCDFDSVLLTIKNVRLLALCEWMFEELIHPALCSMRAEFQFYNLKELWWIGSPKEQCSIDALVSFLKLCPTLEKLYFTIDPESYRVASAAATYSDRPGRGRQLDNLKLITVEGFENEDEEIIIIEHLLREFVKVEPLILVASDGKRLRRLIKVSEPTLQCKENSRMVLPLKGKAKKCFYKFVEEET